MTRCWLAGFAVSNETVEPGVAATFETGVLAHAGGWGCTNDVTVVRSGLGASAVAVIREGGLDETRVLAARETLIRDLRIGWSFIGEHRAADDIDVLRHG